MLSLKTHAVRARKGRRPRRGPRGWVCCTLLTPAVLPPAPAGPVSKLRLLGDSQHNTKIAFIEFETAESAKAALRCSGGLLGTLPLRVSPSKTPVRLDAKRGAAAGQGGSGAGSSRADRSAAPSSAVPPLGLDPLVLQSAGAGMLGAPMPMAGDHQVMLPLSGLPMLQGPYASMHQQPPLMGQLAHLPHHPAQLQLQLLIQQQQQQLAIQQHQQQLGLHHHHHHQPLAHPEDTDS